MAVAICYMNTVWCTNTKERRSWCPCVVCGPFNSPRFIVNPSLATRSRIPPDRSNIEDALCPLDWTRDAFVRRHRARLGYISNCLNRSPPITYPSAFTTSPSAPSTNSSASTTNSSASTTNLFIPATNPSTLRGLVETSDPLPLDRPERVPWLCFTIEGHEAPATTGNNFPTGPSLWASHLKWMDDSSVQEEEEECRRPLLQDDNDDEETEETGPELVQPQSLSAFLSPSGSPFTDQTHQTQHPTPLTTLTPSPPRALASTPTSTSTSTSTSTCACTDTATGAEKEGDWSCYPSAHAAAPERATRLLPQPQQQPQPEARASPATSIPQPLFQVPERGSRAVAIRRPDIDRGDGDGEGEDKVADGASTQFSFNVDAKAFTPRGEAPASSST